MSEFVTGRGLRTPQYTYAAAAPKGPDWKPVPKADRYVEYAMYDHSADPYQQVNLAGRAPYSQDRRGAAAAPDRAHPGSQRRFSGDRALLVPLPVTCATPPAEVRPAGEDHLVRLAEIIEIFEPAVRPVAELRASAVANGLVLARLALGVGQRLVGSEAVTARAARDLGPRVEDDVAEFPGAFDEEVARVDVAVVLHDDVAVAGFMHGAVARLLAGQSFGDVVEEADAHLAPVGPPQVEQLAQEAAVLFRGDGEGQGIALLVELGQRDELEVADSQAAVEPVQLLGDGRRWPG